MQFKITENWEVLDLYWGCKKLKFVGSYFTGVITRKKGDGFRWFLIIMF